MRVRARPYVLTQRVLRLLLEGVRPSQISASPLQKRRPRIGRARIFAGSRNGPCSTIARSPRNRRDRREAPSPRQLDFARSLFARAVETPAGLKIRRFTPLRKAFAQLSLRGQRPGRLQRARRRGARGAAGGGEAACDRKGEKANRVRCMSPRARRFGDDGAGASTNYARRSCKARGAGAGASMEKLREAPAGGGWVWRQGTLAQIEAEMIEGREQWPELATPRAGLAEGQGACSRISNGPSRSRRDGLQSNCYLSVFFTKDGDARGGDKRAIITKGLRDEAPGLLEEMQAEQDVWRGSSRSARRRPPQSARLRSRNWASRCQPI